MTTSESPRRIRRNRRLLLLPILIVGAELIPHGKAQEVTAAITGRVADPSGASVAKAAVTPRDVERGTI